MLTGSNFIGGVESSTGSNKFFAMSPLDGSTLPEGFFEATTLEIDRALNLASEATRYLRSEGATVIPNFLSVLAASLLENSDSLIERAHKETGLSIDERLRPELQRTATQLKLFAELASTGKCKDPRIVYALPERKPIPRPDIRSLRIGIGPVLVIEASNFPFAFGALGGDCASALACGCPVICKSHPGHPGTSELLTRIFYSLGDRFSIPKSIYSLIHGGAEVCQDIVKHPLLRGVGFTGSRVAGEAILRASYQRKRPLDEISLEMGSVNPVFFYPEALQDNPKERAQTIARSILLGGGQVCTNPGILIGPFDTTGVEFVEHLSNLIHSAAPPVMLSTRIANNYEERLNTLCGISGVYKIAESLSKLEQGIRVRPTLLNCEKNIFEKYSSVREEVFGPSTILVNCAPDDFMSIAQLFEGELTATIHGTGQDWQIAQPLVDRLQEIAGRIVFNGVPTGIEVCDSMSHSGPWPAAFGRFTAVGNHAINRWTRPVCFQNVPTEVMPLAIRESTYQ